MCRYLSQRPFREQPPARLKTASNRPDSCSQTVFRIRCPDMPAPQVFSEQADTMPAVFVEFEANLIRKCARESMSAACDSHADNLCIQHAMSFEWDKDKNRANWIKHGIDFETARQIFD